MKQEDKELLLKDLCSRLTYGVKCQVSFDEEDIHIETLESVRTTMTLNQVTTSGSVVSIENVKPYLRSLSSITEEERKECDRLYLGTLNDGKLIKWNTILLDWLNKYHFDFRALIDKGLAIEVTDENNPY